MYVDIVETVAAKVGPQDTIMRAEVTGKILLHCFLPHTSILSIIFNTDFSVTRHQGKSNIPFFAIKVIFPNLWVTQCPHNIGSTFFQPLLGGFPHQGPRLTYAPVSLRLHVWPRAEFFGWG